MTYTVLIAWLYHRYNDSDYLAEHRDERTAESCYLHSFYDYFQPYAL